MANKAIQLSNGTDSLFPMAGWITETISASNPAIVNRYSPSLKLGIISINTGTYSTAGSTWSITPTPSGSFYTAMSGYATGNNYAMLGTNKNLTLNAGIQYNTGEVVYTIA